MLNNIDKIYVVSYVKNENLRANIAYQLYYHGITDFEFYYTYDVSENIINNPNELCLKHLSVSYAHYDLMKRSYELGYNRIIVFEDDVMFLKDKNEFKNTLNEALSLEGNIVFVDYRKLGNENIITLNLQSGYIVDREGMEFYIKNFENFPWLIDQYIYLNLDHEFVDSVDYFGDNTKVCWLQNKNVKISYINNLLCYQPLIMYDKIIDKDKYFSL